MFRSKQKKKSRLDKLVYRLWRNDPRLTEIYLWGHSITEEGAKGLAAALENNTTLTELSLQANDIGPASAKSLAAALEKNTTLTELSLSGNDISNEGAESFANALLLNHTLTKLDIGNCDITDRSLWQKIDALIAMNCAGPEEAARRKEVEYGLALGTSEHSSSPSAQSSALFFVKLMEHDERNVNLKLTELIPLIEDVHQMKLYYTIVATCLRLGLVSESDAASYVKQGLDKSWIMCSTEDAIVVFKLILEKANEDGYIPRADFHRYDNRAEVARMEHAPFVASMREAIRSNTARIEGLEANVVAINASINSIKKGLRRKQKVEATVGFFSAVINAVSFGVGGSLLAAVEKTMGSIVDFGDIVHMKKVVAEVGYSECMDQFDLGVQIASGRIADGRLEEAIKEDNVLVVLSAAAVMVQQPPGEASQEGPSGFPGLFPKLGYGGGEEAEEETEDKPSSEKGMLAMFKDAVLEEEEEGGLPVHAAIKYGDKEYLVDALGESSVDINHVDSEGRTAMDLAALTGQLELLQMVKDKGGVFKFKSPPRMNGIAKKRGPHSDEYLQHIHSGL